MHNKIHPALEELIKDKRRFEAEERIMALVRVMEGEGTPIRAIARALVGSICWIAHSEYMKWGPNRLWAQKFLRQAGNSLLAWVEDTEIIEDRTAARLRNEEAGGTGTPFQ